MSVQSQIDRLAGAKTTLGNYLQQNGVAVPSGATLDEMALQLADVIEKQNKITAAGILKGDGAGGVSAATAGTDYATPAQVAAKQDVLLASGAAVGDLIKVKAVDASGKPTAWEIAEAGTDYTAPAKTYPVTLTVAGWNSSTKQQAVSFAAASSTETDHLLIPTPKLSDLSAYNDAGVLCIGEDGTAQTLTFQCETVPTAAITVYVTVQSVNYQGDAS